MREARIEAAERSAVVVDLRDAEVVRLELLNEALDPLFTRHPRRRSNCSTAASAAATCRGCGSTSSPMSRWAATSGNTVSCRTPATAAPCSPKSYEVPEMAQAVTRYVARRLVERERALADDAAMGQASAQKILQQERRHRRWRALRSFVFGVIVGVAALFALAMVYRPHP